MALLNWVDINFKDSRERHVRKTCTLEPQIEPKFSWCLKKHSISIFGGGKLHKRKPSSTSKKVTSENIYENTQLVKFHKKRSPGMLLKIEASNGASSYVYTMWKERIENTVRNKMEETGNETLLWTV